MVVRFNVFMATKIYIEVFWVVTSCSDVVGHRRFGGETVSTHSCSS